MHDSPMLHFLIAFVLGVLALACVILVSRWLGR